MENKAEKKSDMKVAAFFDIDNTLLKGNTAVYYGKYLRRNHKLPFSVMMEIFYLSFLNRINKLHYDGLARKLFHLLAGHPEDEVDTLIQKCFDEDVKQNIYLLARQKINEHKAKGHIVVLVSASQQEIVDHFKKELQADFAFGSQLEKKNGEFTGNLTEILYHEGKKNVILAFAQEHKIDLSQSFVYSDSFSDMPMFSLVGNPVATNPDGKLKKKAKENNWEIIHF